MKRFITPILSIALSVAAFSLVVVWFWHSFKVQKGPTHSKNSNSALADCAGYYLWNKDPNGSQGNILTKNYDLNELAQTAQSLGYTTSWPTEHVWISLRKQVGQDTYNVHVQDVSRTDDRQRITTVLTTVCNKPASEVKRALSAALEELSLETDWINDASVEIDHVVYAQ